MIFNSSFRKTKRKTEKMAIEDISNLLDSYSVEDLKAGMENMTRLQKEYCARANARARLILNSTDSLNKWLDEKTRDAILDRVWELQVYINLECILLIYKFIKFARDNDIQETVCRFCGIVYMGHLAMTDGEHEHIKNCLIEHYEDHHEIGWMEMGQNLYSNKLPYI